MFRLHAPLYLLVFVVGTSASSIALASVIQNNTNVVVSYNIGLNANCERRDWSGHIVPGDFFQVNSPVPPICIYVEANKENWKWYRRMYNPNACLITVSTAMSTDGSPAYNITDNGKCQ